MSGPVGGQRGLTFESCQLAISGVRVPAPQPSSLPGDAVVAPFCCRFEPHGPEATWVSVAGELDLDGQPHFDAVLRQAQRAGRAVIVDLREVTFMDCSGLRAIIVAARRAQETDRSLALIRGPAQVDRLLMLTGVGRELEILDPDPSRPWHPARLRVVSPDRSA